VAVPSSAQAAGAAPTSTVATSRYAPFATAREFVVRQYVDILRRQPSATEITTQVSRLDGGLDPADLIAELVESPEANANIKSVVRLYRAYYLRNPDFRGLTYWIQRRLQGARLDTVSTEFARAPEFGVRYGILDDEEFVDFVYEKVMRREPDADGRAYWLRRLGSDIHRGQFMTLFSESAENLERTSGVTSAITLYQGMFQRGMKLGPADTLAAALRDERTTVAETAAKYLADQDYTSRF
jgi:hypothetical protein